MAENKSLIFINAVEFCEAEKFFGRIRISEDRWNVLMKKSKEEGHSIYFPKGYYVIGDSVLIKFLKFTRRQKWIMN